MKNEAFTPVGVYHKRYEAYSRNPLHGAKLRFFYKEAQNLVDNLGWENKLVKSNPRFLLCGTGSYQTSKAFVEFVHDQNPKASVHIIDLNMYPLGESKKRESSSKVHFAQANALLLPFKPETFDAIETDFFLQFFSNHDKKDLFKEWFRILKPNGIVTTRDFVSTGSGLQENVLDVVRRGIVKKAIELPTYGIEKDALKALWDDAGFESGIYPIRVPIIRYPVPLMHHIIARKRPITG